MVIAWSNGKITIPIGFEWWISKEYIEKENYRKKIEIAQGLILKYKDLILHDYMLFDGLYSSISMLNFLETNKIKYIIRMPKNRKVESSDGICEQLKNHPSFKFKKNQKYKTVKVEFYGVKYYITVQKLKDKNGKVKIVFLVSNMKLKAKSYVKAYKMRWNIEKMFRTLK